MFDWKRLLGGASRHWPFRRSRRTRERLRHGEAYNRYDALMVEGRVDEAVAEMLRILAADPGDVIANFRLGNHYAQTSRPSEARTHFLRAVRGETHHLGGLLAKGVAARSVRMTAEAEQALGGAHAIQPGHLPVAHHLAMLLLETDRSKEALAVLERAAPACEPAVELYEPWALALALDDRQADAEEILRRLAPLYGDDVERPLAFARRADDYGATDLAAAFCAAALAIADRADIRAFRDLLLPQVPSSEADIGQRIAGYGSRIAALAESGLRLDAPPPWLGCTSTLRRFFYGRSDPALAAATARTCVALCPDLATTAAHCTTWRSAPIPERLRVGFFVPTYYPLLWGLSRELDRGRFTTVHIDPSPGTAAGIPAWGTAADRTVSLAGLSLDAARDVVANERFDIIISDPYEPLAYQLTHARLAPVQCSIAEPSWCDGFANLDYHISWAPAEPSIPALHYSSPLALMERPPYWFERDHCRPEAVSRADFDLPPDARWYVCPQTPMKFHPAFDRVLGQILERDPEAVIVLLRGDWPFVGRLRARLRRALGPRAERVRSLPMLPAERAHGLLKIADAAIDTWPIGGMWSAYTALQLGVPTVTMPADLPFGRWMTAMYERIGVTDLIARDAEGYVHLALRLAADPAWRRELGARIAERHTVLVEDRCAVRELEQFLRAAAAAAHRGEAPRTFIRGAFVDASRAGASAGSP